MVMHSSDQSHHDNPVIKTAYAVVPFSAHVTLNHPGIAAFASELLSDTSSSAARLSSTGSYTSLLPIKSFWAEEPLHPIPSKHGPKYIADWIFLVSLLNFSFWSEMGNTVDEGRFAVTYADGEDGRGSGTSKDWTGYWSLPAAVNRALHEGVPATTPEYWTTASAEQLKNIFRSSARSREEVPLLDTRIRLLREAGQILVQHYQGSFYNLLLACTEETTETRRRPTLDALNLVEMVVDTFPMFRDEATHSRTGKVYFWKRPQILVAELWAAFESVKDAKSDFPIIKGIANLTMFADYRVPQILNFLNLIDYSPALSEKLARKQYIESGSDLEIELRALSIVAVEELRKAAATLLKKQGRIEESEGINAVLLDFWLWNKAKEWESQGKGMVECHRTRSIWY